MPDERKFYQNISDVIGSADIVPAIRRSGRWRISGRFIERFLAGAAIALAAVLTILFAGDYAVFRYRVATNRNPYGTVSVDRFYSIAEKNNRTEFDFAGSETQTCVNALFPHSGDSPCWYLSRHHEQQIQQ